MLYNGSDVIRDLEWVIFDEVHYINDAEVITYSSRSRKLWVLDNCLVLGYHWMISFNRFFPIGKKWYISSKFYVQVSLA